MLLFWKRHKDKILETALVLVGNTLVALAVALFFAPRGIAMAGVTGLSLLLSRLLSVPTWVFVLLLNGLLLGVGYFAFGRRFFLSTVLSSAFYPFVLGVFEQWLNTFPTVGTTVAVAFGGALLGAGIGCVIRAGASTGGMDIPELLLQRATGMPLSYAVLLIDAAVLLLMLSDYSIEKVLEGALAVAIQAVVMERVVLFGSAKMQIKVVTNSAFSVASAIMESCHRGTTLLHARTGYEGREGEVVLSVLSARQVPLAKRAIREVDENAFVIVNPVSEIQGRWDE